MSDKHTCHATGCTVALRTAEAFRAADAAIQALNQQATTR